MEISFKMFIGVRDDTKGPQSYHHTPRFPTVLMVRLLVHRAPSPLLRMDQLPLTRAVGAKEPTLSDADEIHHPRSPT